MTPAIARTATITKEMTGCFRGKPTAANVAGGLSPPRRSWTSVDLRPQSRQHHQIDAAVGPESKVAVLGFIRDLRVRQSLPEQRGTPHPKEPSAAAVSVLFRRLRRRDHDVHGHIAIFWVEVGRPEFARDLLGLVGFGRL